VTTGCSAALTHATLACVTGGNPDLHIRIPDLRGFAKDECIIPQHSRNVYDAAVRAVGVRVIAVSTAEELEAAFGPRTALAYILAGPNADEGPLSTRAICEAANRRGVPVLVDAAAEIFTVPNVHLKLGAALVAYSGGKCLRGPQAAGLLLGPQGPHQHPMRLSLASPRAEASQGAAIGVPDEVLAAEQRPAACGPRSTCRRCRRRGRAELQVHVGTVKISAAASTRTGRPAGSRPRRWPWC